MKEEEKDEGKAVEEEENEDEESRLRGTSSFDDIIQRKDRRIQEYK